MRKRVEISGLSIDAELYQLIDQEIAPSTGIDSDKFWQSFAEINAVLGPRNKKLLATPDKIQQQLDD